MALNVTIAFPRSADASAVIANGLLVQRFELREAMSELFELTVELLLTDPAFDVKDAVGQLAGVSFGDEPFLFQIEGMVRRMRQLSAEPTGVSRYELLIVPPLWLATRRRDHRIFQDKSVIDVVKEVLQGYGGRIPELKDSSGDHAPREYCVQYGETDYDFICRILADEGISFFFDHANGSAFTLIHDTTISAPRLTPAIPFSDPSNQSPIILANPGAPHVQTVRDHLQRGDLGGDDPRL